MINKKPNIFEFATKELSQDAVLLYLADCFNYEETREIGKAFLRMCDCDLNGLDRVYPIKQYYISDKELNQKKNWVDVLLVLDYKDYYNLLIIEDKTNESPHGNQLERYKSYIDKKHIEKKEEFSYWKIESKPVHHAGYIYFKPLLYDDNEKIVCERIGYKVKIYNDFLSVLESFDNNPILSAFLEYFVDANETTHKIISAKTFGELKDISFERIMSSYYGQWSLMKLLLGGDESTIKMNVGGLYQDSSFGRPWTQYRFIFDLATESKDWKNLDPSNEIRGKYSYFFRLDQKGVLSCRQYCRNKQEADEAGKEGGDKDSELKEIKKRIVAHGISLGKLKRVRAQDMETRFWEFDFKSLDDLAQIHNAVQTILQIVTAYHLEKYPHLGKNAEFKQN